MFHMNLLYKKTQSFLKKNKTQLSAKVLNLLEDFLKEREFLSYMVLMRFLDVHLLQLYTFCHLILFKQTSMTEIMNYLPYIGWIIWSFVC